MRVTGGERKKGVIAGCKACDPGRLLGAEYKKTQPVSFMVDQIRHKRRKDPHPPHLFLSSSSLRRLLFLQRTEGWERGQVLLFWRAREEFPCFFFLTIKKHQGPPFSPRFLLSPDCGGCAHKNMSTYPDYQPYSTPFTFFFWLNDPPTSECEGRRRKWRM